MRRTKCQVLPIAFGKRVRKPHHTMRIATVPETKGVAEFMDRFGGRTFEEKDVRSVTGTAGSQPGEREYRGAAMRVGFAEWYCPRRASCAEDDNAMLAATITLASTLMATMAASSVEHLRRHVIVGSAPAAA